MWGDLLATIDTGDELHVLRFSIFEALNRPYEVTLFLRAPNAHIELDKVVNRPASLTIDSGGAQSEGGGSHLDWRLHPLRANAARGEDGRRGRVFHLFRCASVRSCGCSTLAVTIAFSAIRVCRTS